jgi:hypothetical protein
MAVFDHGPLGYVCHVHKSTCANNKQAFPP